MTRWGMWAIAVAGMPLAAAPLQAGEGPPSVAATQSAVNTFAPLRLNKDHDRSAHTVIVGQKIVIGLKGNPTTGYRWTVASIKGEAAKALGQPTYMPKQVDGRRAGSGGVFVFSLLAARPGKSVVTLHYKRHWEKDKPPRRTFSVTLAVEPDRTAERAKKLRAGLGDFALRIKYLVHSTPGDDTTPMKGWTLMLLQLETRPDPEKDPRHEPDITISEDQAARVVDLLAQEGWIAKADGESALPWPEHWYLLLLSSMQPAARTGEDPNQPRLPLPGEYVSLGVRIDRAAEVDRLMKQLQQVLQGEAASAVGEVLKGREETERLAVEWVKKKLQEQKQRPARSQPTSEP